MAAAVEVFRTNALENRRLEQEANAQRSQSEEQRRRTAEQEHARAEAMARATNGLADGLKQLAAGHLYFPLGQSFADRKSVESGKRVSVRVDLGGRGNIKK